LGTVEQRHHGPGLDNRRRAAFNAVRETRGPGRAASGVDLGREGFAHDGHLAARFFLIEPRQQQVWILRQGNVQRLAQCHGLYFSRGAHCRKRQQHENKSGEFHSLHQCIGPIPAVTDAVTLSLAPCLAFFILIWRNA